MDKILKEHPIAAWTLDEDFLSTGPFTDMSSYFSNTSFTISSVSASGTSRTFTTSTNHNFILNSFVYISAVVPTGYRGFYRITAIPALNQFTIENSTTGSITTNGNVVEKQWAYQLTPYNTEAFPGYVFSKGMLESRLPLAYGSNDAKYGSFLLPSFGMFSDAGKYSQYTIETWVKIKRTNSLDKYKLIGTFNTTDGTDDGNGLYYNNTSLILKIGNKKDIAFIKQINKPMLIQITYSSNSCSLFLNGEEVIKLILEESDISMLTSVAASRKFLSFQNAIFDCPAIYPYILSAYQNKVHYAYGQAVSVPEKINKEYGSKTISIDFSSAKYSNNLNYPNNAEWKHGISDNLVLSQYSISNKEYSLPDFNFYDTSTETIKTLKDYLTVLGSNNWNLKYSTFSTVNSNIEFENMDLFNEKLKGFYTHVTYAGTPSTTEKTIFKIINKFDKNYFKITMQYNGSDTNISYKFKYNSNLETTLVTKTDSEYTNSGTSQWLIGIDIEKFSKSYGNDILNFFNNLNDLTLFAFGDNDITLGNTTPDVDIQSLKFFTQSALDKRSTLVRADGTFYYPANANTSGTSEYVANTLLASYELDIVTLKKTYNVSHNYNSSYSTENYFTVGSSGYWKDQTPLIHFAKNVTKNSTTVYTLDFIQFNVDYDAPVYNTTAISGIKYFDTTNSNVKTYITFEPISETYKTDSYFTTTKLPRLDRVVEPDSSWATTKYEVVDGMIIYLPPSQDISTLKIVTHVEIYVSDTFNNTVSIKTLELASQALNDTITNPVGTKYSNDIIPYTYNTSNSTYDYDLYNPFIIEKIDSPYLNLERLSGIRLVGFNRTDSNIKRGIRIPLNEKQMTYSKLNSINMFVYYDATIDPDSSNTEAFQFTGDTEIFNIVSKDTTTTAYLSGSNNTNRVIKLTNTLGGVDENVKVYINGDYSATPIIYTNTWTLITIVFSKALIFDNFIGQFNITGPIALDNISFYGFKNLDYLNSQIDRTWSNVLNPNTGSTLYTWNSWTPSYWVDLLIMQDPTQQPMDATLLYNIYTGTNILYPGTYSRDSKTLVYDNSITIYSEYISNKYTYPAL
jgi:hypothetical protein